jgi:DMSO/TMAO reductase YedYZ molybdopterin-dependent catalytic subunit
MKGMISMEETPISRGFRSKRPEQTPKNRVPPGQYVTTDFPVLSAGPTPQTKVADWTFVLQLEGSLLGKWGWAEFEVLPQTTIKTDIHCVTKWTKLDTTWRGVTFDDLLKAVGLSQPPAPYIMAHCDGGYTTNVPVADLVGGRGMVVTRYDGLPILPAHGGGPAPGAASLLLEEREMGSTPPLHVNGRTRLLGITRIPQLRRSLERAKI